MIGLDRLASRPLDPRLFTGAPRFGEGGVIGSDEVPILAHAGEGVFTQGQMAALGAGVAERDQSLSAPPITINLHVSPGVPEAVRREFIKLIPQIKEIARQAVLGIDQPQRADPAQAGRPLRAALNGAPAMEAAGQAVPHRFKQMG